MKIFAAIFIYLICTFNNVQADSYSSQMIHQEYETAIEVSKKFQQGLLSKEEANAVLISTYSDYSHPDGKIASLTQFVKKTTSIENPIINAASEQRGWSGCEVYSIQIEKSKEAQFFLKIFPYDSKHYLPEIFGLSLMNAIKEVDSPKICVCGQCFINEMRCFLVLETPVQGISIQQYFRQVAQHQIDSTARRQSFIELCEAVHSCGIGLARFHAYLPAKKLPLPKESEESIILDLTNAVEELEYEPKEGIEIEKLQAYTEHILKQIKAHDHLIGLSYDDIKTIHTFYDFESKRFSLVNPDRLFFSFNQDGDTQGLLIKDVCKYILSLRLNRFEYILDTNQNVFQNELLTEKEIAIVIHMFELGYQQGGGILPNSIENEYVSLQHDLFFIKNSRRSLPEPELTRLKALIAISLENIRSRLKEFK